SQNAIDLAIPSKTEREDFLKKLGKITNHIAKGKKMFQEPSTVAVISLATAGITAPLPVPLVQSLLVKRKGSRNKSLIQSSNKEQLKREKIARRRALIASLIPKEKAHLWN